MGHRFQPGTLIIWGNKSDGYGEHIGLIISCHGIICPWYMVSPMMDYSRVDNKSNITFSEDIDCDKQHFLYDTKNVKALPQDWQGLISKRCLDKFQRLSWKSVVLDIWFHGYNLGFKTACNGYLK